MGESLIWVDGALHASGGASLGDGPAGELLGGVSLAYGLAAFEGILATENLHDRRAYHVLRLGDHLRRLQRSTRALGWELPYGQSQLEQAVVELLRRLGRGCYYIRPLVFSRRSFTEHDQACSPSSISVAINAVPFAFPAFLLQMNRGRRVTICTSFRSSWPQELSGVKISGKYLGLLSARAEAQRQRYDEAILLDEEGLVAEASTANLFIVRKQSLITPTPTSALPGVTRRCVLDLAAQLALSGEERPLPLEELFAADEVFLTNTAGGIVAVEAIDDRWRASGHEQLHRIRQAYIKVLTGEDATRAAWLTRVVEEGGDA